jgi:hypothetical protein
LPDKAGSPLATNFQRYRGNARLTQVYDYVRLIKNGKAFDRGGTPINLPDHTPFYAYIVCDITAKLTLQAENASLTQSPDSMGYFGYHPKLKTYVEIISFDKVDCGR